MHGLILSCRFQPKPFVQWNPVTEPRESPAPGALQQHSELVVDQVDDPRFPLLTRTPGTEHGLRLDPETGRVSAPQRPSPNGGPSVVRAPPRESLDPARRRAGHVVLAALVLPLLAAAAIGALIWDQSRASQPSVGAPVSAPPPDIQISTGVRAGAPDPSGIAVAAAANGGLWYQTRAGKLTRLASDDGSVNYAFTTDRPALGLSVSGDSVLTVVGGPAGASLIARDRGTGKVQSRVPLPGVPAGDAPLVAGGHTWVALDDGAALVDGTTAALVPVPGLRRLAGSGNTVWALSDAGLVALDAATGKVLGSTPLPGVRSTGLAAGAGAVWVAGTRNGRPVVLRFDGSPGRPHTIRLPARPASIAAANGTLWVALQGGGVRELNPSTNALSGAGVSLPDQTELLSIRPDQVWAVREAGGRARFTRLDLSASPS
jgi:hypothetical protein